MLLNILLIALPSLFLYLITLTDTIYGGDGGDLVSAIITKGFAHPPGYPLYTILGRMIINLNVPLTDAGKITLISLFSTVVSLILVFSLLKLLTSRTFNKTIAYIVIWICAGNYLIWLYAIVPEVFPLNVLIILSIFFSALIYKKTEKFGWLYILFFLSALGIAHHHTYILIIPGAAVLIWEKLQKIKITTKKIFFLILSTLFGLIPLIYLPVAASQFPEIIWGRADTLSGFFGLLSRQVYGTFVPGQFISNSPIHRFIQLLNIHFFVLSDFSFAGYLIIIFGIYALIKSRVLDKKEKTAVFLSLFLYGPFFFFYANFPLSSRFELATVERFMLVFYFLLIIPYYFGLQWIITKLIILIKYIVGRKYKLFVPIITLLFMIIPVGLVIKNYRRLITIKKIHIAEKMGRDILMAVNPKSIVLLGGDTVLFNTQYVYYSNKKNYKDIVVIQSSKISTDYYRQSLKFNYPHLKFSKKNDYEVWEFINDNMANYNIYSSEMYTFPETFRYKWIIQGLLFKLASKDYADVSQIENTIKAFWDTAENKNLADYYLKNKKHWLNYFPNEILRIYATAHQNTAYYYLGVNKFDQALFHIKQSLILNPEDLDSLFLESVYYAKMRNCREAEKLIVQALNKNSDKLYLYQLDQLTQCYKDESNKTRINKLIKKYSQTSNKLLPE